MQVQPQYALWQNFVKIKNSIKIKRLKIENSIRRLSFLCGLPDIKTAWVYAKLGIAG